MRRAALLLAALAASGCVAETVRKHKPRKGPVKVVGFVDFGGGEVRYLTEGWGWFVAGRRRHARRLMRKNCGKELAPQVLDEFGRQDADVPYSGDDVTVNLDRGMEHFKIQGFQHLVYECRPKAGTAAPAPLAPAPAVSTAAVVVPAVSTAAAVAPPNKSPSEPNP